MDDRRIERATERWHDAGIIDQPTVEAIRSFEANRSESEGERRIVRIIALMGAGLVGAGLLVYLATQWDDLGRMLQTGILIAIPVGLGLSAWELDRRVSGRIAAAVWLLTAISVGPSLLLFRDLYIPDIAGYWPIALWGAIVVPLGLWRRSALTSALGLGSLLVAVGMVSDGQSGIFVSAILGAVILLSIPGLREEAAELVQTYQLIGLGITLIPLLWMALFTGQFGDVEIAVDAYLVGGMLLGFSCILAIWIRKRREMVTSIDVVAVSIPPVATSIGIGFALLQEVIPAIVHLFGVHILLGGTLIAIAGVASLTHSRPLVNLVAVGFLGQVFTILGAIMDSLSGAMALIVSGIILVVVAIGVERGRRRLVATFTSS